MIHHQHTRTYVVKTFVILGSVALLSIVGIILCSLAADATETPKCGDKKYNVVSYNGNGVLAGLNGAYLIAMIVMLISNSCFTLYGKKMFGKHIYNNKIIYLIFPLVNNILTYVIAAYSIKIANECDNTYFYNISVMITVTEIIKTLCVIYYICMVRNYLRLMSLFEDVESINHSSSHSPPLGNHNEFAIDPTFADIPSLSSHRHETPNDDPGFRVTRQDLPLIQQLPVKSYNEADDAREPQCAICLMDYVVKDRIKALPCFHKFHENCVDVWFKKHTTCPKCKFDIHKHAEQLASIKIGS